MIYTILILLQLKHWYIDFVNQSETEVISKGHYGEIPGIMHSLKHGIGTGVVFLCINPYMAASIGLLDFILHYHIDWCKRNYGNQDMKNPKFWRDLGLDQCVHQMCYIFYSMVVIS